MAAVAGGTSPDYAPLMQIQVMTRLSMLVLLALGACGRPDDKPAQNSSQNPAQNNQNDKLSLDRSFHDFGKILHGKAPSTTFKLRNIGKKRLRILREMNSCSCADIQHHILDASGARVERPVYMPPKREDDGNTLVTWIEPGETLVVSVRIVTSKRDPMARIEDAETHLLFEDPEIGEVVLGYRFFIDPPILVDPAFAFRALPISKGSSGMESFELYPSKGKKPFRITRIEGTDEVVRLEEMQANRPDGHRYKLIFGPFKAKDRKWVRTFWLHTDLEGGYKMKVMVGGSIVQDLEFLGPKGHGFGRFDFATADESRLGLRYNGQGKDPGFEIRELRILDSKGREVSQLFEASLEHPGGKLWNVVLRYKGGVTTSRFSGTYQLHSLVKGFEQTEIGVTGFRLEEVGSAPVPTPDEPSDKSPDKSSGESPDETPDPSPGLTPRKSQSKSQSPLLRLAFSQWMEGHLEPCGCASAQSGGLDRRGYWLKRNKHLYDLALEGGNLIEENNPLEDLKLQTSLLVLRGYLEEQGYGAIPIGPVDLSLGIDALRDYDEAWGPIFFCSDLRQKISQESGQKPGQKPGAKLAAPFATFRILKAAGYKLLLLNLAGRVESRAGAQANQDLIFLPPQKAIEEAMTQAGKRGHDYDMVICFAYESETLGLRSLIRQLPGVDLLVGQVRDHHLSGAARPEVYERKRAIRGVRRTSLIFPGGQGRRLLLWKGLPDAGWGWKSERLSVIDLPARRNERKNDQGMPLTADADIWMQLRDLKQQIADQKMVEKLAGRRPTVNGARYVGNKACSACHSEAMEVWEKSSHANAWHSLEERDKADRLPMTLQPDCVRCHTVGFGEVSGYASPQKTPELRAVGCENCHGAGSRHIEAMKALPKKASKAAVAAAVKKGGLIDSTPAICARCHDSEQSPGFQFKDRWQMIRHK